MDNHKINKIMSDRARSDGKRTFWERYGACDPAVCGGSCCRYTITNMFYSNDNYFHKVTQFLGSPIATFKFSGIAHIVTPFHCPNMQIDGRCDLHGGKSQSFLCDVFPAMPSDAVFHYVKKVCGFSFKKAKVYKSEDKCSIPDNPNPAPIPKRIE